MRRLMIASAAVAAFTGGAAAADLVVEPPVETAVAAPGVYDWTGVYGGAHVGYGWSSIDLFAPAVPLSIDEDGEGMIAGGQIGFDYQIGNIVLGLQTDIAWSDVEVDEPGGGEGDRLHWLGTTTARLGYAVDRFLVYGKGGLAYGEASGYNGPLDDEVTETHLGWVAGGGGEYAVTDHVSLFAEYNYVDLGEEDYVFPTAPGLVEADITLQTVKAGVNLRF